MVIIVRFIVILQLFLLGVGAAECVIRGKLTEEKEVTTVVMGSVNFALLPLHNVLEAPLPVGFCWRVGFYVCGL